MILFSATKKKAIVLFSVFIARIGIITSICASDGVTSRIKYLSVTVKAASYTTALTRLSPGDATRGRNQPTFSGSELTAATARRGATSVASSSRKDVQNAAVPLT